MNKKELVIALKKIAEDIQTEQLQALLLLAAEKLEEDTQTIIGMRDLAPMQFGVITKSIAYEGHLVMRTASIYVNEVVDFSVSGPDCCWTWNEENTRALPIRVQPISVREALKMLVDIEDKKDADAAEFLK